jgi:hypothetical protein
MHISLYKIFDRLLSAASFVLGPHMYCAVYSSVHEECNYGIRASQTCSSLTKSKVNSIYTCNFK